MWSRPGATAEVVEERVKLLVCALGLSFASFALEGKYPTKGSASAMPQISPSFGNCGEDVMGNRNPSAPV